MIRYLLCVLLALAPAQAEAAGAGRLRARVGGGGVDPGTINYATLLSGATWYAWDPYQSTLFQNSGGTGAVGNGDPVGYVADLGSGGFNVTQATAGNRPTYTVSGNLKYLTLDGSNDQLNSASGVFTMAAPWSRICLIRQLSWTNGDRIMEAHGTSFTGTLSQEQTTPNLLLYDGGGTVEATQATLNTWVVTFEIHQHPTMTIQINNNTAVTGNPGTVNSANGVIIGNSGSGSRNGHFDYGGCVQRAGTFTNDQINTIKAAYAYRAGITL